MRLDIIPGSRTENPGHIDIVAALGQAYREEIDALILHADPATNQYMQVPGGGFHIEYSAGREGPIYAVDEIPLTQATELFLKYAAGDDEWRTSVPWAAHIERLRPPRRWGAPAEKSPARAVGWNPRLLALCVGLGVLLPLVSCCALALSAALE